MDSWYNYATSSSCIKFACVSMIREEPQSRRASVAVSGDFCPSAYSALTTVMLHEK